MKKALKILLVLIVVAAGGLFALRKYTKTHSPEAVASFDQNGLKISVKYCQPSVKGREIFGKLVPYGQVWRTGANEATEITFSKDIKWGDTLVKAGTYTLFTIPAQGPWTAILNGKLGQWGQYTYDAAKNVAQEPAKTEAQSNVTEMFTISFVPAENGADMLLVWDKTKVTVPVRM